MRKQIEITEEIINSTVSFLSELVRKQKTIDAKLKGATTNLDRCWHENISALSAKYSLPFTTAIKRAMAEVGYIKLVTKRNFIVELQSVEPTDARTLINKARVLHKAGVDNASKKSSTLDLKVISAGDHAVVQNSKGDVVVTPPKPVEYQEKITPEMLKSAKISKDGQSIIIERVLFGKPIKLILSVVDIQL
jgi:hypothetical protein